MVQSIYEKIKGGAGGGRRCFNGSFFIFYSFITAAIYILGLKNAGRYQFLLYFSFIVRLVIVLSTAWVYNVYGL